MGSMISRPRETLIWMVEYRPMPTSSSRSAGMAIRTLSTASLFNFCILNGESITGVQFKYDYALESYLLKHMWD